MVVSTSSSKRSSGGFHWAQEAHINWELNERISLSSANGSVRSGCSIRSRGSESQQQQQRVNTGCSSRRTCPSAVNSRGKGSRGDGGVKEMKDPGNGDENEISVLPPDGAALVGNNGTPVQRRWNAAKDRLERTNNSLAKRLSVIQELNRKIMASYDKMHETSGKKKSRWKPGEASPDVSPRRQEKQPERTSSAMAERKRVLGEKMTFRRRAGGEWSFPEEDEQEEQQQQQQQRPTSDSEGKAKGLAEQQQQRQRQRSGRKDCSENSSQCTLLRSSNAVQKKQLFERSPPIEAVVTVLSANSSLLSWAEEPLDESAQEKSALRELNEAIDRFEEEEEDECDNDDDDDDDEEAVGRRYKTSCHDSSWDSGVSVELASCTGAGSAVATPASPTRGTGWLRVHTGIESSLVYLTLETTVADVCRDMLLSENLSLFVQYGSEPDRRLSPRERPLELQEQLLEKLGYREPTRRARLGLDAELRHLIQFHVGPSSPLDELRGYSRCGYALVLKGLVFPQWKKRAIAILGSRLFLYPACSDSRPEWMELAGGSICCAPSRLGKLVLRVTGFPARVASISSSNYNNNNNTGASSQHQHRLQSSDGGGNDGVRETRHLYIGFHHPWDRDHWRSWLKQACQTPTVEVEEEDEAAGQHPRRVTNKKLDMREAGMSRLPEAVRAFRGVREFFLGHNQLAQTDGNLKLLLSFPELEELHLENNRLGEIPKELLSLKNLTFLDLSDNAIQRIPPEITSLASLRDLILDRNDIKELPNELEELRQLLHLSLAGNLNELLPSFLLEMRALASNDVLGGGAAASNAGSSSSSEEKSNLHNTLSKVNLRNNQLKGNIILGNYGNITHLDLSENNIETLDLSALHYLRSVRCARNLLTELTLCGRNLVSLIAGNNKLKKLTIVPAPVNLEHLDVSYNELDALPDWTPELPVLRALFASHNRLTALPDRLLSQPAASRLEVLHLPHNRLQALPPPRRQLSLVHLTLQDNALTALPVNFFANTLKMKVLNLSNNRLSELPGNSSSSNGLDDARTRQQQQQQRSRSSSSLEKLYLTGNSLTNTALDVLAKFGALTVLHLAYNALDTLPEICVASWQELEELVLSGNKLQYLPDNVANLPHLKVLRVHSNRLLRCPAFNKTLSLKVLDLAHNHLDHLNLDSLLSAQLQFLDISCNSRLHVDPRQFQSYHSTRRPVSLVDVSGQSKSAVPVASSSSSSSSSRSSSATSPTSQARRDSKLHHHLPWRLGFSETAGARERLLVSQIRMPSFCNSEGLFGLFDGGSNQEAPTSLQEMIPRLLLEERTIKETRSEYLRYTLLSAQRELREKGQKYGADAALVHITRLESAALEEERPRYLLTAATCGEARAVLCRASGPLQLTKSTSLMNLPRLQAALAQGQKNGAANFMPIAEPTSEEVILEEDDEFVIVGNKRLWEVLSIQEAVRQARAEANPVLAAKRLQDLGQAYGAEDNLSVIVVRLSTANASHNPPAEPLNRLLMRELRQAVHSKASRQQTVVTIEHHQEPPRQQQTSCTCPCCMPRPSAHEALAPCCCHAAAAQAVGFIEAGTDTGSSNGFYLNGVLRNVVSERSSAKSSRSSQRQDRLSKDTSSTNNGHPQREERSSPSGQSDQTSDVGLFEPRSRRRTSGRGGGRFCSATASACKIRQQQQQQQQQQGSGSITGSERSPPPSDEQLRCWEYMLEQNTQMLFDKELDTLTSVPRSTGVLHRGGQSRSTPQLGCSAGVPFLSRRFGSARSFDTTSGGATYQQPLLQPVPIIRSPFGGSGRRLLNGGPNAAYFGSLQRLMPYNLEYDFAVIQERGGLDSLEQDASRMQQYWGVATTEL